jgi:hypothetical protein
MKNGRFEIIHTDTTVSVARFLCVCLCVAVTPPFPALGNTALGNTQTHTDPAVHPPTSTYLRLLSLSLSKAFARELAACLATFRAALHQLPSLVRRAADPADPADPGPRPAAHSSPPPPPPGEPDFYSALLGLACGPRALLPRAATAAAASPAAMGAAKNTNTNTSPATLPVADPLASDPEPPTPLTLVALHSAVKLLAPPLEYLGGLCRELSDACDDACDRRPDPTPNPTPTPTPMREREWRLPAAGTLLTMLWRRGLQDAGGGSQAGVLRRLTQAALRPYARMLRYVGWDRETGRTVQRGRVTLLGLLRRR